MQTRVTLKIALLILLFSVRGFSQTKNAYMVSTAHLDTQWDWTAKTSIDQYIPRTLNENFALFEQYPEYKFNWEGAIHYMWAKEYYPAEYARLKGYVAQGKWNVAGNALDANDVNVPSPESNFRNLLLGRTFFKNEFGKSSTDLFLPDCFGFGYALPTIAKHCGLNGFSTQKLDWGSSIPRPFDIGTWQGVDGSKIMAALNPGAYVTQVREDLSFSNLLLNMANNQDAQSRHPVVYRYYGTGDRGGSPGQESVDWMRKSVNGTGPLKINFATSDQLYNSFTESQYGDFKNYNGELIMQTHGTGCYTSHAENKKWNRKNELLGDAAERSAVMADWIGGLKYPAAELYESWKRVIWHQFHDDLTGTSIPEAYTLSWNDHLISQKEFASTLTNASGALARKLDTRTQGRALVVYNPLSIAREDVVEASLSLSSRPAYMRVYNQFGTEVPAQILSYENGVLKFLFVATVSPVSHEVYDARVSTTPSTITSSLKVSNNVIENAIYRVTINSNGDVSSMVDKRNGKELLSSPVRLGMLNDVSIDWPSWEIKSETVKNAPRDYVDGPRISIAENGLVRGSVKIERQKGGSTFVQYLRLTNWGPKERLDFVTTVDWNTKGTLLKAIFPFSVANPNATYDLGLGAIQRNNNTDNKYEVPAQQWADITDPANTYGVSVLNDCKYGWDKPADNTLRLSLIHTPAVGGNYVYQGSQDLGMQSFTYAIYGHNGTYSNANTVWEAEKLNQPLIAFESPKHDGSLGKRFSMVSLSTNQVAIKQLKKAEGSDDYVVRVYETKGQSANNVKLNFCTSILAANELNGVEDVIGSASTASNTLTFNIGSFQPKTFRVRLAAPTLKINAPESTPVTLTYDDDAITPDTDRGDGNFDGNGISYSAELLPDVVVADGIGFKIGPKSHGSNNIIRCNGNVIPLPEASKYKKIYILAASSINNEEDTQKGVFKIGTASYELSVPYFAKFVGQWGGAFSTSYFKESDIGWTGTHRHNGRANKDDRYDFTYLFKYSMLIPAGATQLVLPVNKKIAVFSVSLANNENDDVTNVTSIIEKPFVAPTNVCHVNNALGKAATASGSCGPDQSPQNALDGDESTKWCHNAPGEKWLEVDLGSYTQVCGWKVIHAGAEDYGYVTKDFALQVKDGGTWTTVDAVVGNVANVTERPVNNVMARYLRLLITNSGGDDAARIYEFKIYGTPTSICGENQVSGATATASGTCNPATETAAQAIDADYKTKWCDLTSGDKWLTVDLKKEVSMCRWTVLHAGTEDKSYITKNFALQVKSGDAWITVDQVTDNTSNLTDRPLPNVKASTVRLLITAPPGVEQNQGARIYDFKVYGEATSLCHVNNALGKAATASGSCGPDQSPQNALDGDEGTKWCHNAPGEKWLAVDLGSDTQVCGWKVIHAGVENAGYITKDFALQAQVGGTWTTVDAVTGNAANVTERPVSNLTARYLRLLVTNSGNDDAARIYEFNVFGTAQNNQVVTVARAGAATLASSAEATLHLAPNPAYDLVQLSWSGLEKQPVALSVLNAQGKLVYQQLLKGAQSHQLNVAHLSQGLYLVRLQAGKTFLTQKFLINR